MSKKLKQLQVSFNRSDEDKLLISYIINADNKTGKLKALALKGAQNDKYIKEINNKNLQLECQLEEYRRANKELHDRVDKLNDSLRLREEERHTLTDQVWQLKNRLLLMKGAINELENRSLWGRIINRKSIYELPEGSEQ